MTSNETPLNEETLDPQDWETMRELGHRMIDDVMDDLKTLRDMLYARKVSAMHQRI